MPFLRADEAPTQAEREKMPEHAFGDPENKKYPIDTPEHVRAAASYAAKEHNEGRLSDAKFKEISARINKAREKFGIGDDNGDRADADRVERFDLASGEVTGHRTTPQGGLIVSGRLTRAGVFHYLQPDGSVRRELRHPDDVFDKASLDSLAHAPVTIDHPDSVSPKNFKDVAVGHVADAPKRDGKFVASSDIRLQDADAIEQAKTGKLQEFSCGYSCNLDRTPGEYNGEPYDAKQTDIRYNHVAAGPPGWGRAGPEVRMRLDGGCAVSGVDTSRPYVRAIADGRSNAGEPMTPEEKAALEKAEKAAKDAGDALEKVRADSEKATTAAEKLAAQARLDAARIAELEAKNNVLELQAKKNDSAKGATETQARLDAQVEETIAVRATAAQVLGADWKHDGKSNAEIKREVLKELVPDYPELDKLEGAPLDAAYGVATRHADSARADRGSVQAASVPHKDAKKGMPGAEGEEDDDEKNDAVKKAQDAMCARNKDAWKTGKKWDRQRARDAQRSK